MHELALGIMRLMSIRHGWALPLHLGVVALGLLVALSVITLAAAMGTPAVLWRRLDTGKKKPAQGGFSIQALRPEELV